MDGGRRGSGVHAVRASARDPALEHVKLARRAAAMAGADVRTSRTDGGTDRGMTVNIGFEAEVLAHDG